MSNTSRYAALGDASMYDTEGGGDLYELEVVQRPARRPSASARVAAIMPERYHQALDAYLQGRGGSEDSDSDGETTLDGGTYSDGEYSDGDGGKERSSRKPRRSSLDMIMRKNGKQERNGNDDDEDLEAQPAWMHDGHHRAENNVLRSRLALPTIIIILLVVLAAFFAGHSKLQTSAASKYLGAKKKLTLEESLFGTYWAETKSIDWLGEAGDGVYSYKLQDNSIMLHDLTTNTTRRLVEGNKITNEHGTRIDYSTFQVSPDLRYILFGADRAQAWRHSSRSNFWIHDLEHSTTVPLIPTSSPPKTSIAEWAPKGHNIAFVQNNDLYISTVTTSPKSNNTIIRITNNGNETIFNGVPDWVYEEEVFSSDSATWWSPDGKKLAFLSFDESEVHVFSYPIYNPDSQPGALAYPLSMDMRYPKPGTPNPKVTLHLFDLSAYESGFPVESATYTLEVDNPLDIHNKVVTEVAWVGDNDLIIKETNRAASRERVAHFNFATLASEGLQVGVVTRDVDYAKMDGGWAPAGQRIHGMRAHTASEAEDGLPNDLPEGYLDITPDDQGYMHLALFSPADAKEPVFLTSGEWEIDGVIQGVDLVRRLAYVITANPSIERHLYSVALPTQQELEGYRSEKVKVPPARNMTDTSLPGFYDASFSPKAGYYLLGQKNGIPWQKVNKVDDSDFNFPLTDNAELKKKLAQYSIPKTTFMTAEVNNVSINVAATLPPSYDVTGRHKYPVLLRPYGGPNSQMVQNKYKIDWTHYLASEGYIVLEIDGRGTGFRGRKFRSCIQGNLGELEAKDQIAVAEWYRDSNPFVDPERIGIQGWSYGGYLTAKVIETKSTSISLGMSVAPVTDWRYYDTIYTERYMGTLENNKAGYDKSSIHDMEGFKHADYLLLHGSGDDNVHYVNSAALLDRLTLAKVEGFRFRMFTDSAHSMSVRGAYTEVFKEMSRFLADKFGTRDALVVADNL